MTLAAKPRLALAAIMGLLAGAILGWFGALVLHYNEEKFGVAYSSYRFEWLAVPSLPGHIISQIVYDHDWQVGEAWSHRISIVGWNSVVYGAAGLVFGVLAGLKQRHRKA